MNNRMLAIILIGLLLILAAILFVRIYQYKRQMKLFAERIRMRKEDDIKQSVTVEYFDNDVVNLAIALNEYTDMVKEKTAQLESERKQLKKVIAGISHDFRTPLTAAKGYMQLIQKSGQLDDKNFEYLSVALAKTDYLKTLSDAFFEVSSLDAKEDTVELTTVNITKLLTELCLGQYAWISEKGLSTDFSLPEQDVFVRSNEELLKRIFENFFSNAAKYSKTYFYMHMSFSDDEVAIEFSNDTEHGKSIDITQVFQAFYREDSRHSEGAGLGLYIVKCLADKLGHTVEAEYSGDMFRIWVRMERR